MDLQDVTAASPPGRHDADRRRGVGAFLAIAFGLAWVPFLPALFGGPALPVLMPFAPAIAAVVVRRWVTREGFGDAGLRPRPRRWPFYLVALLWPLAVVPVRALVAPALGAAPAGFAFPWGVAAPSPLQLLGWLLVSVALIPIFFGEEFGWRGYLQVRLLAATPLRAAVATGLIWGVWHFPLILAGGQPTADRLQTLLVFPPVGVIMAVFLGWLRERTGGAWAASLGHAANNITALNLTSLAFAGHVGATLDASWTLPTVLAEASILLGVVAIDGLLRRRRGVHIAAETHRHARAAVV